MRVRFLRHRVGTGTLGRPAPAEPGDGQIETAPPEMHGARFADEARAELVHHVGAVRHRPPPDAGRRGVVRFVRAVFREPDRTWNLDRHRPDLHGDPKLREDAHHFGVEVGDGFRRELDRLDPVVVGADVQLVRAEVEDHLERRAVVRHRHRRETARAELKRRAPPVIDRRRQLQPDLADDLDPHVERGAGVRPRRIIEGRPLG